MHAISLPILAGIPFIRLDIWQLINFACSGHMGTRYSLIKYLKEKGFIMMGMSEDMLSPLEDKVNFLLMGQAAQSGNLPNLTDNIGLHPLNCLVPYNCLNHIDCKRALYAFAECILGLDPVAAFLHVNKAIDKTLLLASIETVDNHEMHERQV
jgi:hypothetical protein